MSDQSVARRQEAASELLDEIVKLQTRVAADGHPIFATSRELITRPTSARALFNLGHYLAFRQADRRQLQRRLMAPGLSSLGHGEGRVLATLDAVAVALDALAGKQRPERSRSRSSFQFFRGERMLKRNTELIFGAHPAGVAAF